MWLSHDQHHTASPPHRTHRDEIVDDIFDLLLSCSDFITFKQTILSYKTVITSLPSLPTPSLFHCAISLYHFRARKEQALILVPSLSLLCLLATDNTHCRLITSSYILLFCIVKKILNAHDGSEGNIMWVYVLAPPWDLATLLKST